MDRLKWRALFALATMTFVFAGCGSTANHSSAAGVRAAISCPEATGGHGAAGVCGPRQSAPRGLSGVRAAVDAGVQYPDLSNNDPCVCGPTLKAQGYKGLIVKANQGTGFIDRWAVPMVQSARAAGLAVGAYDFDQNYTVAEAATFVSRLHAAGIFPGTPNTFPAYLDVEFGNFNYSGLLAQIAYLRGQGYRVGIYTGDWYWRPHAGCRWPAGVSAWISGYPSAVPICGLPSSLFNSHQFTDAPFDKSVFLGPGTFAQFVNATPPVPPITVRWRALRNLTFAQYLKYGCKFPQQSDACRHFGATIERVQGQLWTVYPRKEWGSCFGPKARLLAVICRVVRPEASHWSHVAAAAGRLYDRLLCDGPASFPAPVHSPVCDRVRRVRAWFGGHASALVRAYS